MLTVSTTSLVLEEIKTVKLLDTINKIGANSIMVRYSVNFAMVALPF